MTNRVATARLRVGFGLALAVVVLHLLVAGRYDFFRDELYFIVCGRHPAFGYVDQPPLIPLWAALSQAFGENLVILRLPAAMCAAATVYVACAFVRLLGGGRFAELLAGVAVGFAPMFLGLDYTLNTSIAEPLAWTLVAYLVARRIVLDDRAAIVWLGVVVGVALECKYAIPFYLIALAVALLLTPQRRILATREMGIAAAVAFALASPSLVWQAMHGWPFIELLLDGSAAGKNAVVPALAFLGNQIFVMNVLFAPVWIAGIAAPFTIARFAPLRSLSLAYLIVCAMMIASHGKDYYLAPAYATLFAIGAVAIEPWLRWPAVRTVYVGFALVVAAVAAPLAIPVLSPAQLVAYMHALHITSQSQERSSAGSTLPQLFADQMGWRDLARQVAGAYVGLSPDERARTAIIASNYGEAAALDVYGPFYGLPPALSGHNNYYLWGTHGYDGSSILRINADLDRYRKRCATARQLLVIASPDAVPDEQRINVIHCRTFQRPLGEAWPDFKFFL